MGNVIIGKHTYGADRIKIFYKGRKRLTIGRYCSIARGARVFLGGNHRGEWISTFPLIKKSSYSKGGVTIGNDVWIGYGVTILSGVTIADGAIVGAMSVVTKDIPPYSIACGNPAEVKKYRFEKTIIDKFLEIKWWDWDDKTIEEGTKFLMSSNVYEFIEYAKGING